MGAYPVIFDVERPTTMGREHVFLRILLVALLSWILGSSGSIGIVYILLPIVAAVLIAREGGERYLADESERVTIWIAYLMSVLAYFAL